MKMRVWLSLIVVALGYALAVFLLGFKGPVALTIHFLRLVLTVAATIIYIQMLPTIFEQVPPPRRDYLLAGLNFMLLSAVCFSLWNEAGRLFGVDTSVFSDPIAGLFSLLLIVGSGFALVAPDVAGNKVRLWSIIGGFTVSGILIATRLIF